MKPSSVYSAVDEALLLPRLIRLGPNLFGAPFFLMKLLPARFILDAAARDGRIGPGSVIAETTSGTFGLALAILCNLRGYRFIMVCDPIVDAELARRITDLGGEVVIVTEPAKVGGYQRSRLDRLEQILASNEGSFCPAQYDNPRNPGSYALLAEHLTSCLGQIDCLVGAVGSGGSMCGTSASLRLLFPHLTAIGVDTCRSVLFGQPDGKRLVRGLGNSLMPPNLDHSTFDEVHWVDAANAFLATRVLHREHSLFMGGTSGAAYLVAKQWAEANPDATAVALLPDEGYRYQSTIYDDAWLRAQGLSRTALPAAPRVVSHPHEAAEAWSSMRWGRRTYEQVMGRAFSPGAE